MDRETHGNESLVRNLVNLERSKEEILKKLKG